MLGCDSECRWSNMLFRKWAGTTGRKMPVNVSQVGNVPEPEDKCPLIVKKLELFTAQAVLGHLTEQPPSARNQWLHSKHGRPLVHKIGHQQLG